MKGVVMAMEILPLSSSLLANCPEVPRVHAEQSNKATGT
jgi:hypothetical protein